MKAEVDATSVTVGSATMMSEADVDLAEFAVALSEAEARGDTSLFAALDGTAALMITISDTDKPGAAEAVAALHAAGIDVAMISGDSEAAASSVARRLGIDRVIAGVRPDGKVAALERLQEAGPVAFVGDGINDAPALAAADVGLAIGTGTDVAIEAADVVLTHGDPRSAARAITISRATMSNIRQNLVWAFGYNVALIPVAAGVLYPMTGWLLSPALAAGAMALSSLLVVGNALRLKRLA